MYGLQGLPVVKVNGDRFSKFWDCNSFNTKLKPLIAAICKAYTGSPKPQACKEVDTHAAIVSNIRAQRDYQP